MMVILYTLGCVLTMLGLGSERVQTFPIPENRVVPVLVHPLSTTTVVFPDALHGVEGIGFSSASEDGGDYYLNMIPQKGVVSLSAWKLPVPPRNLQVYMGDTLITLLVIPVEDPSASLFQLHLLKSPVTAHTHLQHEDKRVSHNRISAGTGDGDSAKDQVWWKWGQLEFYIVEQRVDGRDGTMCIQLMIINGADRKVFLNPQQVKVKVDDVVAMASYLSVTELPPQRKTLVEMRFPLRVDSISESSVVEVMLGYGDEKE